MSVPKQLILDGKFTQGWECLFAFLSLYCLSFFNLVSSIFSKMILVRFMFMLYVVKCVFACFCD